MEEGLPGIDDAVVDDVQRVRRERRRQCTRERQRRPEAEYVNEQELQREAREATGPMRQTPLVCPVRFVTHTNNANTDKTFYWVALG